MKKSLFMCLFVVLSVLSAGNLLADNNNLYTDDGIPEGTELWTWSDGDSAVFTDIEDASCPEGVSYKNTNHSAWAGWGIVYGTRDEDDTFYESSMDLTDYSAGNLVFWISSLSDLKVGIQDIEKYEDDSHVKKEVNISDYDWDSMDPGWQKIEIPLTAFTDVVNLSHIFSPFTITSDSLCDFSVDKVYYTVPISSGYTASTVSISSNTLYVNGTEFYVKGINFTVTPVRHSTEYDWSTHVSDHEEDLNLIQNMNANTIRTYDPVSTAEALDKLSSDELSSRGLYIIMGYYVPVDKITTSDGREMVKRGFLEMVSHWKNHPAILMWCLGNEVPRLLIEGGNEGYIDDWYALVADCTEAVRNPKYSGEDYEEDCYDANHPIITAEADIGTIGDSITYHSDDLTLPWLDAWGIQAYRGDTFSNLLYDYTKLTGKPMIMLEFGCDSYDSTRSGEVDPVTYGEEMQADVVESLLNDIYYSPNCCCLSPLGRIVRRRFTPSLAIYRNPCFGICLFSWCDEWWKSGDNSVQNTTTDWTASGYDDPNMNEEWFGIVAISSSDPSLRTTREAYDIVTNIYATDPKPGIKR